MSITKCIIGKSIGNCLKLIFLEQHKIKNKLLTRITKLKIRQLIDNKNNMHSLTTQNSKIEFAELVSYLITHTPNFLSICQQHRIPSITPTVTLSSFLSNTVTMPHKNKK